MHPTQAIRLLQAEGTAQNRKIYARHGVNPDAMYGVSFSALGKLQKKIGVDHALALTLWKTGNHDARILATMVADPEQLDDATLEKWVKDLDSYVITDAFSSLVGRSEGAMAKAARWTGSNQEWISCAGWNLFAGVALHADLPDKVFEDALATIEKKIHDSPNRVRHSMNQAVICIGSRNSALERKAIATAKRIGTVEVDHGQTSCKTPDAVEYIARMKKHESSKKGAAKKKATKKKAAKKRATKKKAAKKKATKKKVAKKKAVRKKATKKKTSKKKSSKKKVVRKKATKKKAAKKVAKKARTKKTSKKKASRRWAKLRRK